MKKLGHKPAEANRTFGVLRKIFNLAEVWGYRTDGTNPCRHVPMYPAGKATRLNSDEEMVRIFRSSLVIEDSGEGARVRLRHQNQADDAQQPRCAFFVLPIGLKRS